MNSEVGTAEVRSERSRVKQFARIVAGKLSPLSLYLLQYQRSSERIRSKQSRAKLFEDFLAKTSGPCLQISVKNEYGRKFGENWVSVDKYDHGHYIDRHDDVQAMEFPDNSFNAAVCWSVLEHVPDPQAAVRELYRVLKPGGLIWVQLPFLFPYHADPHDYWRVTPSGLRMWMKDFQEDACGCDYWAKTSIVAATFFCGRKPGGDPANSVA